MAENILEDRHRDLEKDMANANRNYQLKRQSNKLLLSVDRSNVGNISIVLTVIIQS